jgi:hypothetical protein
MIKLAVVTPVYGSLASASVSLGYHLAASDFNKYAADMEILPYQLFVNADLCRSRSRGLEISRRGGFSHTLFWDEDVVESGRVLLDTVHAMIEAKKDIVAAPYPHKTVFRRPTANGPYVPMGFTLVSLECANKMARFYHELTVKDDKCPTGEMVALFMQMIHEGYLLGEDFSFCQRALAIGLQTAVLDIPMLGHVGGMRY